MRNYCLYVLIDPIVMIPKYVGISNNAERRFKEHIEDISNTPKVNWINRLKEGGKLPILKVIKNTSNVKQVCAWERKVISEYKEKWGLTNATKGGEYYAIGTPIDVFDLKGNYLDSYDSMIEFAELKGLSENAVSSISAVCLRKRNYAYNYIYRYAGDTVTEEDLIRLNNSLSRNKTRYVYITDLEGNLLGEFETARRAEFAGFGKETQILSCLNHPETYCSVNGNLIMDSLDNYPKLIENYLLHINDHGGWITQYDLNGNYINRFPTISGAIKSLGKTSFTGIRECLSRNTSNYKAYGFMWRYSLNKDSIEPYKRNTPQSISNTKRVRQFTLNGEFIKEFNSAQEAAKVLNIKAGNIRNAANGSKKSSAGYIWKYV